jgi:hypothetical protein
LFTVNNIVMDVLHQDSSTPYINIDYNQSTSPNNSPHQLDSFDSFDFDSSPPFPHTPSYNGSYQNSPYSANSELSFSADQDNFPLFDDDNNQNQSNYDPSEYDNPNSSSLLMFNDPSDFSNSYDNTAQLSISLSSTAVDHRSPHSFDYSSPSSNGGAESGPECDQQQLHLRSRGSSISDTHRTSPRLDVAQFENMRFESPNWGSKSLPLDRPLSPPIKPLSPPQLRIPPSPISNSSFPPPPTINAPSGDGGLMSGPQLHIVPATPVSGGGAQTQPVQFQSRLETLRQDVALTPRQPSSSSWNPHSDQITISEESQSLGVPQFGEQAQVPFTYSHESSANRLRSDSNNQDAFLFPLQPRHRSKSDTSLQHPQWNADFMNPDHVSNPDTSAVDDSSGTINMNDVPSADPHQSSFSQPVHLLHHFNFGGDPNNNFLSPDAGVSLRRSKSDSGRPGHQRQSRSEDIRSPSSNFLFPPSSQQDFINRQFLHPQQESLPAIRGRHHRRASSGSRGITSGGHYAGGGGGGGSWSNSSSQRPSPYPSPNPSPHSRYNELPNVALPGRHAPLLHPVDVDAGLMLQEPGQLHGGSNGRSGGVERTLSVQNGSTTTTATPIVVSRPNVTTGRTANASHKRRKQEATFSCPVPNCGSTFTRSFNLKGHLRSHNEEKPFQCHWPGCGKGFARQHDCKRHEQLHTNYRPYTCEGCSKPFARMDALNRHREFPFSHFFSLSYGSSLVRSEGGAECQKTLAAATSYHAEQPPPLPVPKTEVDGGWGIVL